MAFDGIVTMAAAKEMRPVIISGKIDKVYQPRQMSSYSTYTPKRQRETLRFSKSGGG